MKLLTIDESVKWCLSNGFDLNENKRPGNQTEKFHKLPVDIPKLNDRLVWLSQYIEAALTPRKHCLLWVTSYGIWPSSENWHLYYKLRQSYGDFNLIEDAPGHLFLQHESSDIISFLQLGLTASWDMHLLPSESYGRIFISHDGWIEFNMVDEVELERIVSGLKSKN